MNKPTGAQREMIETVFVPTCVVATPGSGKTATVVIKIHHLLCGHESGYWTYQKKVLALSYTKEAANSLEFKVQKEISRDATDRLQTGTFHSYFLKALKKIGAELVHRRKNISSEAEVEQIMGIAARRVYEVSSEESAAIVSRLKTIRETGGISNATTEEDVKSLAALNEFEALMKEDRHFDFTSILQTAVIFLKSKGKEVERTPQYQEEAQKKNYEWEDELDLFVKADHIIVDEAQDLDRYQMDIILELSGNNKIVDIVGDDDQSIYGFRGGLGYKGMKEFMEKTDASPIKFEQNFRSRPEILRVAQQVIDENVHRIPKTLNANHGPGCDVLTIDEWEFAATEVDFIVRNIAQQLAAKADSGSNEKLEIGILARKNKLLDHFELALKLKNIDHYRAPKDDIWSKLPLTAFVEFMRDPKSIGPKSGARQCLEWAKVDSDLVDLRNLGNLKTQDGRTLAIVEHLVVVLNRCKVIQGCQNDRDVSEFIAMLFSWFLRVIKLNGEARIWSKPKQEHLVKILRVGARTFGGSLSLQVNDPELKGLFSRDEDGTQVAGFKGTLSKRISSWENSRKNSKEGTYEIKLLTMHGSKGLEFDEVWLVGCDDSTIPGEADDSVPMSEWERLEEERRILYVGITRAKNILHISHSKSGQFDEKPDNSRGRTRFLNVVDTHRIPYKQLFRPPTKVDKLTV